MAFFGVPYTIFFEDTMAYGSHHYLTNFRFQCIVRETLIFEHLLGADPSAMADFTNVVMLTREGYSRNYAPAMLGERVAILLSFAEPTRSSIRLCVRTLRADGEPVAAGYQTIVFTDRTGGLVPFPRALDAFTGRHLDLGEALVERSFAEAVVAGTHAAEIFGGEVRALARAVCAPDWGNARLVGRAPETEVVERLPGTVVLAFPGQGSLDAPLLRALAGSVSDAGAVIERAELVAQATLGASFAAFVAAGDAEQAKHLRACPDLDQFGIFVTGVLLARSVVAAGAPVGAAVGHSFGEIAALCAAGALDIGDGLRVVAERIRALRQSGARRGGMLAVTGTREAVEAAIDAAARREGVCVSVLNHSAQTVLSGPLAELERLKASLAHHRLTATVLASRYPFHSATLAPAARSLASSLRGLKWGRAAFPVYSPIANGFYRPGCDLGLILASHLTRSVDFPEAIDALGRAGGIRFVECGAGGVLARLVERRLGAGTAEAAARPAAPVAPKSPAPPAASVEVSELSEIPAIVPVAIVAMGAVLPGAADPGALWTNILGNVGGVAHLRTLFPHIETDFGSAGIVSDKSYSLLSGIVASVAHPAGTPYSRDAFEALSKAQRLLVAALQQCNARAWGRRGAGRTNCLLGSTADGIQEYDDALFCQSAEIALGGITLPAGLDRLAVIDALRDVPEWRGGGDPEVSGPFASYRRVINAMLGTQTPLVLIDAACASSLYTIDLGMRQLSTGQADVVYAGGVFSPGPANAALFAQFGGLSATGSRPLDVAADGVVFGEGAAVVVLKRLDDAIADGDPIHGVIRRSGLSSDGRSPSVNVPRQAGQSLAVRRAYGDDLDIGTIQYVEAHATATPVGDATEFASLSETFGAGGRAPGSIALGSVKALLGHTGWLAGTASVIKVCLALEARTIPPQHGFSRPNPKIDLAASPFTIATEPRDWPENARGEPRRAAINGFGFGGTNAHLVIDAYAPAYHARHARPGRAHHPDLVAVGVGSAFVDGTPAWSATPGSRAATVPGSALRLPAGKRLMPDVTEQMDTGQFLALAAADAALSALPNLAALRERLGVVVGVTGKARRGVAANERILADRFARTLAEALEARGVDARRAREVGDAARVALKAPHPSSNAYTLVGMMPNVVTGRIANMYDVMGPNMAIDAGGHSLLEAVRVSAQMLLEGTCDVVLAGAVNATAPWPGGGCRPGQDGASPDGAALMLLTTRALAAQHGLTPIAAVSVGEFGHDSLTIAAPGMAAERHILEPGRPHEILGLDRFADALRGRSVELAWMGPSAAIATEADLSAPAADIPERAAPSVTPGAAWANLVGNQSAIGYFTPIRVAAPLPPPPPWAAPSRVAYLTDRPDLARELHAAAGLAEDALLIFAPGDEVDAGLATCEAVVALRDLTGVPLDRLLTGTEAERFAELAFLGFRAAYPGLERRATALIGLALGAWPDGRLHPEAAMLAGLLKSVAREQPGGAVRSVACEGASVETAAWVLRGELAGAMDQGADASDVEIAVAADGTRAAVRLAPVVPLEAGGGEPRLERASVVVASGGGRGITAVLVEGLMQRYGCTVVLLGRSDPAEVPVRVQAMNEAAFAQYEAEFYRERLAADPKARMPALRRAFERLAAGRELTGNLARLKAYGTVEYHVVDIADAVAVDAVIGACAARYGGRVDLVVHGAGVQASKRLPRRSLEDWRATTEPKLAGLRNLVRACAIHSTARRTEYHLLTSAFSAIGNDGQADYGAANEAMGALATALDGGPGGARWTALGWLAWAGVGMTRGSEYAALGLARGLRGVQPEEGKALFLPLFEGNLRAVNTVLLTDGEQRFYGLRMAPPLAAAPARVPTPAPRVWRFDTVRAPYLLHHVVNGTPTLPGSFEIEFAVRTALAARPDRPFASVDRSVFNRFVRVPDMRTIDLRGVAEVVEEDEAESVMRVRLLTDFVHSSGRVLQKDVLHFETQIRLGARPRQVEEGYSLPAPVRDGASFEDPYLSPASPVRLSDMFDCMHNIRIGPTMRSCDFVLTETACLTGMAEFVTPCVLVDALLRLATIAPPAGGGVFVPAHGGILRLLPGINDLQLARSVRGVQLFAAPPRLDGEFLHGAWCRAIDGEGRTIALIDAGAGRRVPQHKDQPRGRPADQTGSWSAGQPGSTLEVA